MLILGAVVSTAYHLVGILRGGSVLCVKSHGRFVSLSAFGPEKTTKETTC